MKMQVNLGEVVAHCPRCGSTQFVHAEPGEALTTASDLICADCEAPAMHGDLILQIGHKGIKAAHLRLSAELHPPRGT